MRNLLVSAVVLGVGGFFGAKYYIQHKVGRDLDTLLVQARPFVDVSYGEVVATIRGELRVEDVTIRMAKFDDELTIESVGVLTPGFLFLLGFDRDDLELPKYLGVRLEGLRASADADFMRTFDELHEAQAAAIELTPADRCASTYGLTPAALKRLGYHEIVMDFDASFRTVEGRLVMGFGAALEDMYEFDAEITLEGATDPMAMARGARPLLVGGRLDYFDRSLNERIVKHCADQQVTRDDVIAAQVREIQAMALRSGVGLDEMLIGPYTDFLLGKPRFTLISAPPKPVDLTRVSLYKPSDVPNLLNLTAEAHY
jgi:hypothetical protein